MHLWSSLLQGPASGFPSLLAGGCWGVHVCLYAHERPTRAFWHLALQSLAQRPVDLARVI